MRAYGPRSFAGLVPAAWATAAAATTKRRNPATAASCVLISSSEGKVREAPAPICDADPPDRAIRLPPAAPRRDSRRMPTVSRKPTSRGAAASRRVVVVAVPPVDELDLVGPLQVFQSVNRLAGRPIYAIEV